MESREQHFVDTYRYIIVVTTFLTLCTSPNLYHKHHSTRLLHFNLIARFAFHSHSNRTPPMTYPAARRHSPRPIVVPIRPLRDQLRMPHLLQLLIEIAFPIPLHDPFEQLRGRNARRASCRDELAYSPRPHTTISTSHPPMIMIIKRGGRTLRLHIRIHVVVPRAHIRVIIMRHIIDLILLHELFVEYPRRLGDDLVHPATMPHRLTPVVNDEKPKN